VHTKMQLVQDSGASCEEKPHWAAHTARLYLYILKEVEGKDVPQSFPAIIGVV